MGTVYRAELRVPGGFRRTCAVKVIRAYGPDRDHFVSRMRDEARLLGMLQDEQILGVNELVLVRNADAVIMEHVEGVDLAMLQGRKRVPPRALAELGAEVAGALHRAHRATDPVSGAPLHVIHRDVKPANMMVTVRGGVRLLDFGVARAAFDSRESQTQGLVLGTLNYFPPEILAGEDPTAAMDVYGLGVAIWECGTGREWGTPRVHQGRFERLVDQKLEQLSSDYRPLVAVLKQMLQWDPDLRPDAGVVERALLHAAELTKGPGLRSWARDEIPPLMNQAPDIPDPEGLLGQTVRIDSFEDGVFPSEPTAELDDETMPALDVSSLDLNSKATVPSNKGREGRMPRGRGGGSTGVSAPSSTGSNDGASSANTKTRLYVLIGLALLVGTALALVLICLLMGIVFIVSRVM